MQKIAFFFLLICVSASCTKIVDIDLNSSDPQIVIEGEVTDQIGEYVVKVTKSVNFSDPNSFPAVQNAAVTISGDNGTMEVLAEKSPGIYVTTNLQGTPGITYTMSVITNGKTYTATSKMPKIIDLQGIDVVENTLPAGGPGSADSLKNYDVVPLFTDDASVPNYYRVKQRANGKVYQPFANVSDDVLFNGQPFPFPIFNEDLDLKSGDTIEVEIQSMDLGAFEYFYSLGQVTSGQSGTPANPVSNISGGAFGYFSAHTVQKANGLVP
jgi:Domain of unknown function (DUF4249)